MFKDRLNFKLLNILIFGALVFLILITSNYWIGVLDKIIAIVAPFLMAFAISYALYPLVKKLKDKGIKNGIAVAIITILIVLVVVAIIAITIPLLYDQLILLSKMVAEVLGDISSRFEINLGEFQTSITGIFDGLIQTVGKYVSDGTFELVNKSVGFLSSAIVVFILSIYFLSDMSKIRNEVKKLLKANKKKKKRLDYITSLDRELGQYLYGLAIFIAIHLVEYSLLFWIVGHPNWLLLGILAALTTVIPYFGGIITNTIAIVLASVVSTPVFIATIVICMIFPQIDGYIISPRLYGKTNNINPIVSIFAVIAGGSLFGIVGIMLSLPVYIVINCTFKFYKDEITDKIEGIKEERAN